MLRNKAEINTDLPHFKTNTSSHYLRHTNFTYKIFRLIPKTKNNIFFYRLYDIRNPGMYLSILRIYLESILNSCDIHLPMQYFRLSS